MKKLVVLSFAALIAIFAVTPAYAYHHRRHHRHHPIVVINPR